MWLSRVWRSAVAKLTAADVEALIAEAGALQLDALETTQVREMLEEARQWMAEAEVVLRPPAGTYSTRAIHEPAVPVTREVLATLEDLAARAEVLNIALALQEALDRRLGTVRDWLARAKAAMADSASTWQLLTGLVKEAKRCGIELPEVPLLAEQQAEQAWVGQAELLLTGAAPLDELVALDTDSARLAETPRAAEMAKRLRAKLETARRWEARLADDLGEQSARPTLKEATTLLAEVEADLIVLPILEELRTHVGRAKAWLEGMRRTQSRSTRGVATRASLPELRGLLEEAQALPLSLPEVGVVAMQIHEAEEWQPRQGQGTEISGKLAIFKR